MDATPMELAMFLFVLFIGVLIVGIAWLAERRQKQMASISEKLVISTLRDWWYSFRRTEVLTSIEFAEDIIRVLDTAGFAIVRKQPREASCKRHSIGPRQWLCENCGTEWFETGMPAGWKPERCLGPKHGEQR